MAMARGWRGSHCVYITLSAVGGWDMTNYHRFWELPSTEDLPNIRPWSDLLSCLSKVLFGVGARPGAAVAKPRHLRVVVGADT